MERMRQTLQDIKQAKEKGLGVKRKLEDHPEDYEGVAVPTINAAFEEGGAEDFEYLLAEAERIARDNPEDAEKMMEALDATEKHLDLATTLPTMAEITAFAAGTTLPGLLLAILYPPALAIGLGSAAAATVGGIAFATADKQAARERLQRVRDVLSEARRPSE